MDNYDDVLQFISKVGDQNLNYRSFQAGTQSSGQSKWHLINQVASYKQPLTERPTERVIALNQLAQPESENQSFQAVHTTPLFADAFAQTPQAARFSAATVTVQNQRAEAPYLASSVVETTAAQQKTNAASGFSHLFKKPQQQEQQVKPAMTDSLSALFNRIGS